MTIKKILGIVLIAPLALVVIAGLGFMIYDAINGSWKALIGFAVFIVLFLLAVWGGHLLHQK